MKLGLSMWSYVHAWKANRIDIPGFIHEAKRVGAQGVELLDFFYRDVDADAAAAQVALAETGLHCGVFSVAQNFAKGTVAERAAELDKIRFGIREAVRFGAGVVRVFAGDLAAGGPDLDAARTWIVEGLTEAANEAQAYGVRLALENHGKLAGRGDQVRSIILAVRDSCGHDALCANPDTGNFILVEQESHEAIQQVRDLAAMVHLKDFAPAPAGFEGHAYVSTSGHRYIGTAIGEGVVDLAACIEVLRTSAFEGWVNVEYESDEDPFTGVPRSMIHARRLLG